MKMVTKIAFANMKYHKSKNLLIGIAITLTAMLLFIVPNFGRNMLDEQYSYINKIYPRMHALYRNVDKETARQLASHNDIEMYGLRSDAGLLAVEGVNAPIMYLDETGFFLYNMELAEGRLPQQADEIVVSEGLLQELGVSGKVGDTVIVPYQIYRDGSYDYIQEKEFTITGFLPDNEENIQKRIYNVLISEAFLAEEVPEEQIVYRFLFRVNANRNATTDDIEASIKNIAAQFGISENDTAVNNENLFANYVDPSFIPIIVGIMLVVVFAGIVTIYSIYYVAMSESVQEYGKLKAIGATKRQIKQIVLREGFCIALAAIPIGLVIGSIASAGVFYLFSSEHFSIFIESGQPLFNWWAYLLAIIVTCVTLYLSLLKPMRVAAKVSEIEAMRYRGEQQKIRKRKKSFTDITVSRLTGISLMGNKKKSLMTIASMGITGIFVMVVATVLSCADPRESASNSILGQYGIVPDVEESNKEHPERKWSEIMQNNPLTEELKARIEDVDGVVKVDCFSMIQTEGRFEDGGGNICGVPEEYAKFIEDGIIEGKATYEELKSGDKVIVDKTMLYWYPDISVGDVLELTIQDGDDTYEKQIEIIAIGDYATGFTSYNFLLMAKEAADALCRYNSSYYFHVFAEKDYDETVADTLSELIGQSELLEMDTWQAQYETWKTALAMTRGGCYAFLGILGVICIMNLVNTMIHNMHIRKKEFGMMQAIGMSNHQLVKMLQLEGLFYTLGTLVLSVGVGSILGYPVFLWAKEEGMFNMSNYHYPFTTAIFVSLLLIVLQMGLAVILGRSIRKESLIERIRFSE